MPEPVVIKKEDKKTCTKGCRERLSDTSGLYYKCFTIVIYNRNDSGQYYKTTIKIVIDDHNWRS
jgi:hypothetical protein